MDALKMVFPVINIFDIQNYADQKETYLVYGYIKQCHHQKDTVPQLVITACLWYYYQLKRYQIIDSFDAINLKKPILDGIYHYGYKKPLPLQQHSIIPMLQKHNIVCHAPSGSSKTATFCIIALQIVEVKIPECQVLIVLPVREITKTTHRLIVELGKYLEFTNGTVMGGTSFRDNIKALSKGMQIICGTPGRILDLIQNSLLKLDKLKLFVLDEADRMFDIGFYEQLQQILNNVPNDVQIGLCTSRMNQTIKQFTDKFMPNAVQILPSKVKVGSYGINQYYVNVEQQNKYNTYIYALQHLFELMSTSRPETIIHCNTINSAQSLFDVLSSYTENVNVMHGRMKQNDRLLSMQQFKSAVNGILIVTDIVVRGLHLFHGPLIINYDMPSNSDCYWLRMSRAAKVDKKGVVITFVCGDNDKTELQNFGYHHNIEIQELPQDIDSIFK